MNIAVSRGVEAFACEMHPEGALQNIAHSVGKLRREQLGVSETTEEFYQRARKAEEDSGALLFVARSLRDRHYLPNTVAYAFAPSEQVVSVQSNTEGLGGGLMMSQKPCGDLVDFWWKRCSYCQGTEVRVWHD